MWRLVFCSLIGLFSGHANATSKDTLVLELYDVVQMAIMQSPSVKNAHNKNINYYWRYQNFKAMNKPTLSLSGNIPDYERTTEAVTQNDGSIKFIPTEINQMNATLSLSQSIASTGTNIYAYSTIERVQNYRDSELEFSGEPFIIGFSQPIYSYNWMKWNKKIEPLVYKEAQKDFIETIEEISYNATVRYFNYLNVKTNYTLAESNLKNSQSNLLIAKTKKKIGRISENDYSRIELSVLNAQKALNTARMNLNNADFELKSYIGLDQKQLINLKIPLNMRLFNIDVQKALEEAYQNRKETPQYQRRLIEAERNLVKAKRNSGLNATLYGSYGLSNSGPYFPDIYHEPETSQLIQLGFSIPILDGGRSKSAVKLAESQYDLAVFDVNKDHEDFERRVVVQVEQFSLLKEQLETSLSADIVANNGYQIAQRKFQNGEISITDLNIFLQEREQAKRDYISTLRSYWCAYYNLRILTLYDFELNQKITYANPLLQSQLESKGLFNSLLQ